MNANPSPKKPRGWKIFVSLSVGTAAFFLGYSVYVVLKEPRLTKCYESAKRPRCLSNIQRIGLACKQYEADHHDHLPIRLVWLIDGNYIGLSDVFICPSDPDLKKKLTRETLEALSSYFLRTNLTEAASSDEPLILEKPHLHKEDGGNVFFVGGQAAWEGEQTQTTLQGSWNLNAG